MGLEKRVIKYLRHIKLSFRRIKAFELQGYEDKFYITLRNLSSFFFNVNKNYYCGRKTIIYGKKNLIIDECLDIGLTGLHNLFQGEKTIISCEGKIHVKGYASIGKGTKLFVGPNAVFTIGSNSYITGCSKITVHNAVTIGSQCALAWNLTIIDSDYHQLKIKEGFSSCLSAPIEIGDNVWIGANVTILKGVKISKGVVVAANSVVTKNIEEECVLVAGNPAVVIRKNVQWIR